MMCDPFDFRTSLRPRTGMAITYRILYGILYPVLLSVVSVVVVEAQSVNMENRESRIYTHARPGRLHAAA